MLKGLSDGLLGDFIEYHALVAGRVTANRFFQVPGNGLSLAVEVGGEIDGIRIGGEFGQFIDDFFLAGQDLVSCRPAVLRIDAHAPDKLLARVLLLVGGFLLGGHLAGAGSLGRPLLRIGLVGAIAGRGQVADVANARLYDEVRTEVLVDGLGLRR